MIVPNQELSAPLSDLQRRGLLHQCTNLEGLSEHLQARRCVYAGFDPTKDSLTIGNLVSILLLRRFQLAGHKPVVVMGGGTGLIGDPSGKDAERTLMTPETIAQNVAGQKKIFERLLSFEGDTAALLVNNADWIEKLTFVEILRDIGKHFSVNMMIQKDSVKSRLEGREHGISYTEFSYMILQALDFATLSSSHEVTVQLGGSDQWGNIVAGVDLTRRLKQREVFGLTSPLITKADGGKFGKTEEGAIWLTPERTSAYAFYQFWLKASDDDVPSFLRVFSLRPAEEVEAIIAEHQAAPGLRMGQKALAEELTKLLHGAEQLVEVQRASQALFSGNVKEVPRELLEEALSTAPSTNIARHRLEEGGVGIVDLMVETSVAKSKREARQFLGAGAVSVNGDKVGEDFTLMESTLLYGSVALIKRGKQTMHLCRIVD